MTADTNYDSVRWGNFLQLNRVLKRYIFQTAYWRSTTAAEDEKESAAHKEEETKRVEEERRRQMDNADHGMMLVRMVICYHSLQPKPPLKNDRKCGINGKETSRSRRIVCISKMSRPQIK